MELLNYLFKISKNLSGQFSEYLKICFYNKIKKQIKMKDYIFFMSILIFIIKTKNCKVYNCNVLDNLLEVNTIVLYNTTLKIASLNIKNFDSFSEININCSQDYRFLHYIQIVPNRKLILDNSLNLKNLNIQNSKSLRIELIFYNLDGIDINMFTRNILTDISNVFIEIDYSKLEFFSENRLLTEKDCNDYASNLEYNFFTHLKNLVLAKNLIFSSKLCPAFFKNSRLAELAVFKHSNSLIDKNKLEFDRLNESNSQTLILKDFTRFYIEIYYDIVSTKIFNEYLFKNMKILNVYGYVYNIQDDFFKIFPYTKEIEIQLFKIKTLFYNGNKWLGYLGFNSTTGSPNQVVSEPKIFLNLVTMYHANTFTELYEYPDEDFCLFSNFPHDKLIYPLIQPGSDINCSCTILFLIRYVQNFAGIDQWIVKKSKMVYDTSPNFYCIKKLDLLKKCNFEKRLISCKRSNFSIGGTKKEYFFDINYVFDIENLFILLKFIVVTILNPFLSFFGLLTNIFVIVVARNIKNLKKDGLNNQKKTKDTIFKHIIIYSCFNVLFCALTILKPINECTTFTLFCSSVYTSKSAQWFKIIFIEFLGNIIKLCCNISYTFITFSRIVVVYNKFGGFLTYLTKKLWLYFISMLSIGILLNLYKIFQYKIDSFEITQDLANINKAFPTDKYNYMSCDVELKIGLCSFFNIMRIVSSFINDVLFFLITIIFDIFLINGINLFIKRKKNLIENFVEDEDAKKRNKLSKMIIINNIIYLISHLPEFLLTISLIIFPDQIYFLCTKNFKCENFNELAQVFIFISIISQLSLNKSFNKIFCESYENIFLKLRTKLKLKIPENKKL